MEVRMLVAEDDFTMRHLMLTILSRQGFNCAVVADGLGAVEAWEKVRFDFVFMDVQMPLLDGLQTTRIIREKEAAQGGHTVIIATTAFAQESDRERCLAAGMDDYMSKPLDLEKLLLLVEKYRKQPAQ